MRWTAHFLLVTYLAAAAPAAWSEACFSTGFKTTCSRNAVIVRGSTHKDQARPRAGEAPREHGNQPTEPLFGQSGGQSGPRTLAPGVYIGANGCLHAAGVSVCDWQ